MSVLMRRAAPQRLLLFALACALLLPSPVAAHPVPFSYLDLHTGGPGSPLTGTLTVHVFDAGHELGVQPPERLLDPAVAASIGPALEALLAPRLALVADGHAARIVWGPAQALPDKQSLRLPFSGEGVAVRGSLTVRATLFPYDPNHQTFINVYDGTRLRLQAIVDAAHPDSEYYASSAQGVLAVISRFVAAGIHHILIGPDHILFLVGLLLLGGTLRRLLLVVSSFTLAHSITLSLAAVNLVSPSPRIIEPFIALSIVYVGIDNLMVRDGRDVRAWIAFLFGFVHGFGFAGVLREMQLPSAALGWSRFSFNLGVEIGQLLIVVPVALVLVLIRESSAAAGRRVAVAGSVVVAMAGAFWFVQRVFMSGGVS